MRKIYVLFFIALLGTSAMGQSPFTVNNCFQVNDNSTLGFSVYAQSFDSFISQTGSNYTWDFSSENWTEPTTPYLFQPATQSIHTLFHFAEINEYSNIIFARDIFYTHSEDQDTLYCDGLYLSVDYPFAPRIPYLSFPLNFQDSVYTYTKQYANPNQPNTATGSVTRYWIYDGFGTVELPYGTINNVYRIRTKQVDSVYIINSGTETQEMIWFRQADGIPVLRFVKNATVISAYYTTTGGVSGINAMKNKENIRVFPDPATDFIQVDAEVDLDGLSYQIADLSGKIVSQGIMQENKTMIDVHNLAPGLYFLQTGQSLSSVVKFLKK